MSVETKTSGPITTINNSSSFKPMVSISPEGRISQKGETMTKFTHTPKTTRLFSRSDFIPYNLDKSKLSLDTRGSDLKGMPLKTEYKAPSSAKNSPRKEVKPSIIPAPEISSRQAKVQLNDFEKTQHLKPMEVLYQRPPERNTTTLAGKKITPEKKLEKVRQELAIHQLSQDPEDQTKSFPLVRKAEIQPNIRFEVKHPSEHQLVKPRAVLLTPERKLHDMNIWRDYHMNYSQKKSEALPSLQTPLKTEIQLDKKIYPFLRTQALRVQQKNSHLLINENPKRTGTMLLTQPQRQEVHLTQQPGEKVALQIQPALEKVLHSKGVEPHQAKLIAQERVTAILQKTKIEKQFEHQKVTTLQHKVLPKDIKRPNGTIGLHQSIGESILISQKVRVDKQKGLVMDVEELIPEKDNDTDLKRIKIAAEVGMVLLSEARKRGQNGISGYLLASRMPRNPGQVLSSFIRKQLKLSLSTEAQYDAFKMALSHKGMFFSQEEIERGAYLATQEAPAVKLVKRLSTQPVSPVDEERAVSDGYN